MTPIVVLILGQSNAAGVWGHTELSLAEAHEGAVLVDNGEAMTAYPERVGPEPWLIDELRTLGRQPTVIIRASNGAPLGAINTKLVPELRSDVASLEVKPDVVVLIQGETDSKTEPQSSTYARRLVGPDDGKALLELLHATWPEVPLVITEMRHTHTPYGAFHEQIRAEQRVAAERDGVCLVPTMDLDLRDKVHYSSEGLEDLGRRIANQIVDGCE